MFQRLRTFFLIYRSLLGDARTPARTKILPWVALLYFIMPLDVIPDLIPLLGQLDDISIIGALLWIAISAISKPLYEEHRKKTHEHIIDVTPQDS